MASAVPFSVAWSNEHARILAIHQPDSTPKVFTTTAINVLAVAKQHPILAQLPPMRHQTPSLSVIGLPTAEKTLEKVIFRDKCGSWASLDSHGTVSA